MHYDAARATRSRFSHLENGSHHQAAWAWPQNLRPEDYPADVCNQCYDMTFAKATALKEA